MSSAEANATDVPATSTPPVTNADNTTNNVVTTATSIATRAVSTASGLNATHPPAHLSEDEDYHAHGNHSSAAQHAFSLLNRFEERFVADEAYRRAAHNENRFFGHSSPYKSFYPPPASWTIPWTDQMPNHSPVHPRNRQPANTATTTSTSITPSTATVTVTTSAVTAAAHGSNDNIRIQLQHSLSALDEDYRRRRDEIEQSLLQQGQQMHSTRNSHDLQSQDPSAMLNSRPQFPPTAHNQQPQPTPAAHCTQPYIPPQYYHTYSRPYGTSPFAHAHSYSQRAAAGFSDPLFAKTEMPKITSKNTEHSIAKLEGWLDINGVMEDERRFIALKMQLDSATYAQVSQAIYNPPQFGKYLALKQAVIKVFTDSQSKKVQDLISGLQLGDKKPSTLLAEMRNLHRGPVDDTIFRELWLNRLPLQVRGIIVGMINPSEPPPLERLAESADRIMEYQNMSSNSSIQVVSKEPPNEFLVELKQTLVALGEQLRHLRPSSQDRSSRPNSRSDDNNRRKNNRSPTPKSSNICDGSSPCVFHVKYGEGQHKNKRCDQRCPLYKEWLQSELTKPKNS